MSRIEILQAAVDKLPLADASAFHDLFPNDADTQAAYKSRICPLRHLGQVFLHPLTLLSAMFDTGCVLTGPHALEFFAPGATDGEKWDFYVPGYKESAADMVKALSLCGVTWQLEGDAITETLAREGQVRVDAQPLEAISSWARHLGAQNAVAALGSELSSIVSVFEHVHAAEAASRYLILVNGKREVQIRPTRGGRRGAPPEPHRFDIMRGYIRSGNQTQEVRLIIGRVYTCSRSFLQFLNTFYEERLHCFVGGWCASHMSYYDSISTRSHPLAPKEYEARGIDSTQAFFVDYGDLYRTYLRKFNLPLFDSWLKERRENAHSIRWTVDGEYFVMLRKRAGHWSGSDSTWATKGWSLPTSELRRLGDLIALNTRLSDTLREPSYLSSVRQTLMGGDWFVPRIARSGGVFGPLPHAGPKSGVM